MSNVVIYEDFEVKFDDSLPEEYIEKAAKELNETPENKSTAIIKLKELLKTDKELNFPAEDEAMLMTFLRPCLFDAERTMTLIQKYYRFVFDHPQLFGGFKLEDKKAFFDSDMVSLLPLRDPNGCRVFLMEVAKWDPNKCSLEDTFRGMQFLIDAALKEPKTQISGVVFLANHSGLSLNQIRHFSPSFARITSAMWQDTAPIMLKGSHVINQPYIFNLAFMIFKPFLSEQMKSIMHFHGGNRNSLFKYLPSEIIPKRFGGTLQYPEIPGHIWYEVMLRDKIELLSSYGYKA